MYIFTYVRACILNIYISIVLSHECLCMYIPVKQYYLTSAS